MGLSNTAEQLFSGVSLSSFVRAELQRAKMLDVAETILAQELLEYRLALKLATASLPVTAKLVELFAAQNGAEALSSPRVKPAFFFPIAQLLEERGAQHALSACQEALRRVQETAIANRSLFLAIDRWSGEFALSGLLEVLTQVTQDAALELDIVPVGPSTSELEEIFSKSGEASPSEYFSDEFFTQFKEAGVSSIEGGNNLDLLLVAAENNMNVAVGHNVSGLSGDVNAARRIAREQFIDELFAMRETLEPTDNFSDWFPWFVNNDPNTPAPLATDILWAIAVGRLLLKNVFFVRAPVSLLGPKLAHVALTFGANDLGFSAIDSSTADALGIAKLSDTAAIISEHAVVARICTV